jgi:hypothetical protein
LKAKILKLKTTNMKKPFTTPGPWTVGKTVKDSNGIIRNRIHPHDDTDNTVCVLHGLVGSKPGPVSNANANLIAAAPELLAALEDLVAISKYPYQEMATYKYAQEIIKKAKGE